MNVTLWGKYGTNYGEKDDTNYGGMNIETMGGGFYKLWGEG